MKKIITLILILLMILMLSASCSSQLSDIASRVDNSLYEANPSVAPDSSNPSAGYVSLISADDDKASFSSRDGSVQYYISAELPTSFSDCPEVLVTPHSFTAEEAQKLAYALFGYVEFYEYTLDRSLSADDMESNISRWESYLTDGTVYDLVHGNELLISDYEQVLSRFKERYADTIVIISDGNERRSCDWSFHPDSYYLGEYAEKEPETIRTVAISDGIQYRLDVANRIGSDFSVHMVSAYLYNESSPNNIDELVQQYELCKSSEPSADQLESICAHVYSILNALNAGDWEIDSCLVDPLYRGSEEAYVITVKARPVLAGKTVIRQPQLSNLRSTRENAQHYYFTDAEFSFTANGVLLSCTIQSPIDIIKVNESCETLPIDQLLISAASVLEEYSAADYSSYFLPEEDAGYKARVWIDSITVGLSRMEITNGEEYKYVPSLCFDGHIELYGKTGELIISSSSEGMRRLLVINAEDGSVINISAGDSFVIIQD